MGFVLTGPGVGQGVTVWNIATANGYNADTTPPNVAFWVGSLANSPIAARLNAAKITSANWSYGTMGFQSGNYGSGCTWRTNGILDSARLVIRLRSQTLQTLVEAGDQSTPVDQFVYTLK